MRSLITTLTDQTSATAVLVILGLAATVVVAGTAAFALASRRGMRGGAAAQAVAVMLLAVGTGSAGVLLTQPSEAATVGAVSTR